VMRVVLQPWVEKTRAQSFTDHRPDSGRVY